MEVMAAIPIAAPSWRAALKTAPTVPATLEGVVANMAMLRNKRVSVKVDDRVGGQNYSLCGTVDGHGSESTDTESRESIRPIMLLRIHKRKEDRCNRHESESTGNDKLDADEFGE